MGWSGALCASCTPCCSPLSIPLHSVWWSVLHIASVCVTFHCNLFASGSLLFSKVVAFCSFRPCSQTSIFSSSPSPLFHLPFSQWKSFVEATSLLHVFQLILTVLRYCCCCLKRTIYSNGKPVQGNLDVITFLRIHISQQSQPRKEGHHFTSVTPGWKGNISQVQNKTLCSSKQSGYG